MKKRGKERLKKGEINEGKKEWKSEKDGKRIEI